MATRSSQHFGETYGGTFRAEAMVYKHWDGYPENMLPLFEQFFTAVKEQCGGDTRFNDPTYLAAKWVVFLADDGRALSGELQGERQPPMRFLGVGVITEDPGDIEYTYRVHCDKKDDDGNPVVEVVKL